MYMCMCECVVSVLVHVCESHTCTEICLDRCAAGKFGFVYTSSLCPSHGAYVPLTGLVSLLQGLCHSHRACVTLTGLVSLSQGLCHSHGACVPLTGLVSLSQGLCHSHRACVPLMGLVSLSRGLCPAHGVCGQQRRRASSLVVSGFFFVCDILESTHCIWHKKRAPKSVCVAHPLAGIRETAIKTT